MHVSLTPKLEELVRRKVESGFYNNASEVIRDALRLLAAHDEAHQAKLRRLREEIAKGEADAAAGRYTTISTDAELDDFFRNL